MPDHRFGWLPDLPDLRDYLLTDFEPVALVVPISADLSTSTPFDAPTRDQGQLGSCTGFAGWRAFRFNTRKQGLLDFDGSPLFLYYNERVGMGTVNSDSGAAIRDIMKALAATGLCHESQWPYNINAFTTQPAPQAYSDADSYKLTQYLSVGNSEAEIRSCIAAGYPVVVGFTVYESFESATASATGDIPMPMLNERVLGGHAVCLVGYDDNTRRYKFHNSWGGSWGKNGYGTLPYEYLTRLGQDFWTMRGVTGVAPTPPPTPTPPPAPAPTPTVKSITTTALMSDGKTKSSTISF